MQSLKEICGELRKDFKEALSHVDFMHYDPFKTPFMKVLFIGQVWMAVKMMYDDDDVQEELDGAAKYLETYTETGDTAYKDMASDELRHAGTLIKKHLAKPADDAEKNRLNEQEKERAEMLKVVSAAVPRAAV